MGPFCYAVMIKQIFVIDEGAVIVGVVEVSKVSRTHRDEIMLS